MSRAAGRVKLIVTIVDRGKGLRAMELYQAGRSPFHYTSLGQGTANSETLDMLGLGVTEKDVLLSLAPEERVPGLLRQISEGMQLHKPGHGIVFTLPLTGICRAASDALHEGDAGKEDNMPMEQERAYDLVVAVINHGYVDQLMTAAKAVGARGGTVIHARRNNFEEIESVTGFSIQPEKEIVAILIPRKERLAVMKAINQAAGLSTEAKGIVFSLPVEEMSGLSHPSPEQAE